MSFISPILLWGLAALSIPLLIHFLRQSPRRRYNFPSLFLLKKVTRKYRRKLVLMELLLLLLRLALIASIVLAFAGPKRQEASAESGGGRQLVILYDDTASMARKRGGTSLFESQRIKMKAILADAGKSGRVTLISATGMSMQVESPAAAMKALGTLQVRYSSADAAKALERARGVFSKEGGKLFLLGDFQKSTWQELSWRPMPGVQVLAGQLVAEFGGAVYLEDLTTQGSVSRGAPFQLAVNVTSQDLPRGAPIKVAAEVEGGSQADTNLQAAPGPRKVLFSLQSRQSGLAGLRVHASSGQSSHTAFGLVGVGGLGRTVVVSPPADPTAEVLVSLLEAAEGPAPAVVTPSLLSGVPLSRYQTIVLCGADPNMANRRGALLKAAEAGVVILSIAGPASEAMTRSIKILPAQGDALSVLSGGENSFWTIRSENAILGLIGLIPGNWPSVRIHRAARLPNNKAEVLARLSNGWPALTREQIGKGAWVTFAMGLSPRESDLAYMPAFTPLLLKLMQPGLSHADWQQTETGETLTLPWRGREAGLVRAVDIFNGEQIQLQVGAEGRVSGYPPPGVWRLEGENLRFAINLNKDEMDPSFYSPDDLTSLVPGVEVMTASGAAPSLLKVSADPLSWARVLTVLAMLLLLAEALYANSRKLSAQAGPA